MDLLAQSILATLNYYDIFDYPLTSWEIYKYLIRGVNVSIKQRDSSQAQNDRFYDNQNDRCFGSHPERLAKDPEGNGSNRQNFPQAQNDFYEILNCLQDNAELSQYIGSKNGFYFLKNREMLYEIRCKRMKLADKRWKKARFVLRLLQSTPFVRGIFLSGSFAIGNIRQDSDIDLLIVAKKGRIWMCRFFVTFLLAILGQRRHGDKIAGKFCLNHYITEDSLKLNIPSLYNAQTYQSLVPVGVRSVSPCRRDWIKFFWLRNSWQQIVVKYFSRVWSKKYFNNFQPLKQPRLQKFHPISSTVCTPSVIPAKAGIQSSCISDSFFYQNKWLGDYLLNILEDKNNNLHTQQVKEFFALKLCRVCAEFVLSGVAGGWLERMMKAGQKKYIKLHSAQNKEKGRVVLSDAELEFHPASPEDKILGIFNKRMEELGLVEFGEQKDSGLV